MVRNPDLFHIFEALFVLLRFLWGLGLWFVPLLRLRVRTLFYY